MTLFEKVIIPLVDENIRVGDFTSVVGFVDSYTVDPDKPNGECELFLVFDDRVRNEYSIERARRYALSTKIKRTYVKYVNGVPYLIYSFWVNSKVKKLYNGIITLDVEQKASILQFWGTFDSDVKAVMSNEVLTTVVTHAMPLEDYNDVNVLSITKGTSSLEGAPFLFVIFRNLFIQALLYSPRR